ncbi:hypothetical protein C8A03DRAFT_43718 [Achaetomium macrosporum]|uniref:Nephrocystin 3-like N-terminal domain-containing protein n=1 Tax=Achaetomium macrosporum TaxID=79813 RepID=A0AAN7CAQ1_9PEZI|nr:hypothetical protein C8A03DRAFT_43718 [Achaetomium macrosporum]
MKIIPAVAGLSVIYEPENEPPIVERVIVFTHEAAGDTSDAGCSPASSPVFWPSDLLPNEYPPFILMPKDFLFTLSRETVLNRPLVSVGHRLGGIIVKEMLAGSSTSTESHLTSVVESTLAVVFLGTPHRGSPDLAALGKWARSFVSDFRAETTSTILQALVLRKTDQERAQESFSALWQKYEFRFITFQEALGLTGLNLGVLGNKVVPDYSSSLGDRREHAVTIQANHMDMCRFAGPDDPGDRKVAGELRSIYDQITEGSALRIELAVRGKPARTSVNIAERAALRYVRFPGIHARRRNVRRPANHTCNWLFENQLHKSWISGKAQDLSRGILWLKGKPGSGKSVLMKEAYATFFFNSKGQELEWTRAGLYRSLLYQLLRQNREQLARFAPRLLAIREEGGGDGSGGSSDPRPRELVSFWSNTPTEAYNERVHLHVLLSTQDATTMRSCPSIIVHHFNRDHIATYIEQKFHLIMAVAEPQWPRLQDAILNNAEGAFLLAYLVVEKMLDRWEEGGNLLSELLAQMLACLAERSEELALRLFQWAILAVMPLRLHEWHHILAFIRRPTPPSLQQWRLSEHFTKNDNQLERQIKCLSKGLLEVIISAAEPEDELLESISHGETRAIRVIQSSVRAFFLIRGFKILHASLASGS